MGDLRALEAELVKAVSSLPNPSTTNHQDHLELAKISRTISSTIEYYSTKLTSSHLLPKILETAETLAEHGHYNLARELHGHVNSRCPLVLDGSDLALTRSKALEVEVRSIVGLGNAMGLHALSEDRDLTLPDTLLKLRKSFEMLRKGIIQALELEEHYWLVYNGTVAIFELARLTAAAGQHGEALPYLVFAALALESNIRLSIAKFLPWRCEVYSAAVECYRALGSEDEALSFVDHGLSKVQELEELQKLDPLPCPQDILDAYEASRRILTMLRFSLLAESLKSEAECTSLLDKSFKADDHKLRALCSAIRAPRRDAGEAPEGLRHCLKALEKLALPLLTDIERGVEAKRKTAEHQAAVARSRPILATLPSVAEEGSEADVSRLETHVEVPPLTLSPEEQAALQHLEQAQRVITSPLHCKILSDAYAFRNATLFDCAVAAAKARRGPHGDLRSSGSDRLQITADLLTALHNFEGVKLAFPDLSPALPLADALAAHLPQAASIVGDILTDAAFTLYHATKPVVDRLFVLNIAPDQTLERLMQALYSAFTSTRVSDPVAYADVAVKLGAILEARNEISSALQALREAKRKVEEDRAALIGRHRHEGTESFFSLTADRSQPTDEVAGLVAGMTEQERALSCLHADLLLILARVELKNGLTEQEFQATKKVQKLEETLRKRDEQAAIFGKRTEKEKREDDAKLIDASKTPSNPRMTEKRLLGDADRNLYEKAVILMAMAEFRDPVGKEQCLRECLETLHQIEKSEATLIKTVQQALNPPVKVAPTPPVPQIVSRTATTVTFLPPKGFRPKGEGRATSYAIYGKAFGAGTSVQMNAIAAQHENLGTKFSLNERCTVRGLKPNDSYTFAIVYFDDQGRVVGELGHSSPEVPMVLALPLFYLYSQLVNSASRLGVLSVARPACSVLWRHFVVTHPDRPVWDANPMDSEELHPARAAVAIAPVLRAFAQCSYLWSDRLGGSDAALSAVNDQAVGGAAAPALVPPSLDNDPLKKSNQDSEIALLKRAKRIIIGLESATLVADEGLICEGAVRLYNCLGPLIAQATKSRLLTKGLLGCYASLQAVGDVSWCKRSLAGSVAIRAVYHLIDLCDDVNESGLRDLVAKSSLPLIEAVRSYRDGPPSDWEARLGQLDEREKALMDLQAEELRHLTEFLLQHRDSKDMAGGVFKAPALEPSAPPADAKKDPKAAAAAALPNLSHPPADFINKALHTLAVEPKQGLAGFFAVMSGDAEARKNPRYLEAVYHLCLRAHQRHMHAEVSSWVDHILEVHRERCVPAVGPVPRSEPLIIPPLPEERPSDPDAEPPAEDASAAPEPQPEVVHRWSVDKAIELLNRTNEMPAESDIELAGSLERVVAAKFLQSRWKLYAARRKAVLDAREYSRLDAPWVARASALQAFSLAHLAKEVAQTSIKDAEDMARGVTTRPAVVLVDPAAPPPKVDPKKGPPPPPPEEPIPDPAETLKKGMDHVMDCIRAASRAVEWSARAGFPWELLNGCKRLHNLLRQLLVSYKDLMLEPVEKGYWAVQTPDGEIVPISTPLPSSPTGAASMTLAPQPSQSRMNLAVGRSLSRKLSQRSMSMGNQSMDEQDLQGLEDQLVDESPANERPSGRFVMVPSQPNIIRLLKVSVGRLLQTIEQIKSGSLQLISTTLPLPSSPSPAELAVVGAYPSQNATMRGAGGSTYAGFSQFYPTMTGGFNGGTTKRPVSAAPSHFSFGSDLVPELWYVSIPSLDIKWSSKFVLFIMGIAQQTGFQGTVFKAGDRFNQLTEGHMALEILPAVKQACAFLGVSIVPYQLALDAAIRDKNQALEELEKCRGLVKQKYADRSPFAFDRDQRIQKKKKRAVNFKEGSFRGSHSQFDTASQARGGGTASVYSGGTASRTVRSMGTVGNDAVNIIQQYKKAIETLEAKGEKWLKAQALNELGDAFAHQREWDNAATAWSDAVDLMMGPYQCIKFWRAELASLSPKDMLAKYGASRILLTIVLLGKLAHLAYVSDLTSRLECAALGAELAHALFTCSALHPQRKLDFAGYRCQDLWVGQDLFADSYQCPIADLQLSSEVLGRVLLSNQLALDSMPILCLLDHLARVVTKDPLRVAQANLLRAEACAMEGRLREASAALMYVVLGIDLPDPTTGLNQPPPGGSVPELVPPGANNATSGGGMLADRHLYDNSQRPSHPQNRAVIERILNHVMHEQLVKVYGAEVVGHIQIARARFVLAACKENDLFFDSDPVSGDLVHPPADEPPPTTPPPGDKKGQVKGGVKDSKRSLIKDEKKGAAGKKTVEASPATEPPSNGLFVGDTGSFEGESLQAAVAMVHQSLTTLRDVMTGSASDEKALVATMYMAVQSEMTLSDLRMAQMLPDQALRHAMAALSILSKEGGDHLSDFGTEIAAATPEFVMRYALLAEPWCNAVARAAELTFELGQLSRAMTAVEAGLEAAETLRCDRLVHRLQGVRVSCLFSQGRTLEGLKEVQVLEARMKRACAPPLEVATLRFQTGEVLDALGLRSDSADQFAQATSLLRQHLNLRGLYSPPDVPFAPGPPAAPEPAAPMVPATPAPAAKDAAAPRPSSAPPAVPLSQPSLARRRFEEVLNLTVPGSGLFVECLLRESRAQFRKKRFQLATDLAREALDVTPRARLPPQASATCSVQLAWCLRHLGSTAAAEGDKEGALRYLQEAVALLHRSIRWSSMDGGHDHDHLHRCYCELVLIQQQRADLLKATGASVAQQEDARAKAVRAMVGALRVAGQRDRLLLSPQTLHGFKLEDAPIWALEALRGREAACEAQTQPLDPSQPEVVGPLLVKHLIALHRKPESHAWSLEAKRRVQLCLLHRFLRTTCQQYQAECCLTPYMVHTREEPASTASLSMDGATGPASTLQVSFIWHVEHDGCLGPAGSDESWSAEGTLDGSNAKDESALLSLAPPAPWVHLIAAVAPPQGPVELYTGALPLSPAHDLQKSTQDLRLRVEASRQTGPALFRTTPPTAASLAKLVRNLQVLLLLSMGRKSRGTTDDAVDKTVGDGPVDATRLRQLEALMDVTRGALVSEPQLVELIAEVYRANNPAAAALS